MAQTGFVDGSSDGETIAASLHEPARFGAVFDRHYDVIWSYLIRRGGQALAEELAAETFVRAFAQRGSYDSSYEDARPWLYGIATNLLRKHARSEARRRGAYARAVGRDDMSGGFEGVTERLEAAEGAQRVAVALARLKPADRDTLLLFALTDMNYEGIAVATGVPVGTVRSRLHRARRQLQTALSYDTEAAGHAVTEGEPSDS